MGGIGSTIFAGYTKGDTVDQEDPSLVAHTDEDNVLYLNIVEDTEDIVDKKTGYSQDIRDVRKD